MRGPSDTSAPGASGSRRHTGSGWPPLPPGAESDVPFLLGDVHGKQCVVITLSFLMLQQLALCTVPGNQIKMKYLHSHSHCRVLVKHSKDQDLVLFENTTLNNSSSRSSNFYVLSLVEVKITSGNNVLSLPCLCYVKSLLHNTQKA